MKSVITITLMILTSQIYGSLDCNKQSIQKNLITKAKCVRNKTTYSLMGLREDTATEYCLLTERENLKNYSKKSTKGEILHSGSLYKFKGLEFFTEFDGRGGRAFLYMNEEFTPCSLLKNNGV